MHLIILDIRFRFPLIILGFLRPEVLEMYAIYHYTVQYTLQWTKQALLQYIEQSQTNISVRRGGADL